MWVSIGTLPHALQTSGPGVSIVILFSLELSVMLVGGGIQVSLSSHIWSCLIFTAKRKVKKIKESVSDLGICKRLLH